MPQHTHTPRTGSTLAASLRLRAGTIAAFAAALILALSMPAPGQPTGPDASGKPLAVPSAPGGPSQKTVTALTQAHTRLTTLVKFFAQAATKAEEEKVLGAASLFRAAGRSVTVQARLIDAELKKLAPSGAGKAAAEGGEAALSVKGTTENLKTALAAAMAMKDTDLPAWRREADSEGQRDAVRVLRWSREGQIELSRYFKDASDQPEELKSGKRAYFVSRTCGFTLDKLDVKRCPVCNAERDDFERVD